MSRSWKMFQNAGNFNQSLCDWRYSFPQSIGYYLPESFVGTACPFQEDPGWYKRGPYCQACSFGSITPEPSAAPTNAPTVTGEGGSTSSASSNKLEFKVLLIAFSLPTLSWLLS